MQRRSFIRVLPLATLAVACGRVGQITGTLPQGQEKQPFVTLRVLGLKEPVTVVSTPGTALEILQWSFGPNAVTTGRFKDTNGLLVLSINGQGDKWQFEVNGKFPVTPEISADTYRLFSGDELVFRQL